MSTNWEVDLKEWEKVPLDAYRFCFEQAQKRLETIINDGEKITNRCYAIIGLVIPPLTISLGFIITSIKKQHFTVETFFSIVVLAVLCYCFYLLSKLILPRREYANYIEPIEIVNSERLEFPGLEEKDLMKSIYVNEFANIQEKINQNKLTNSGRIKLFKHILIWISFTTIVILITMLLLAIF